MATVLLIEDDPLVLESSVRLLRRAGHDVRAVRSVEEAQPHLTAVDVVVTDLGLPGYTNTRVLEVLREQDRQVPIVVVTGQPSVATAAAAVELGATRYLVKPVAPELLHSALAAALTQGGTRALQGQFQRALGTLWFAYQPIVDWSTGAVYGWEALVRGTETGLSRPDELLDAAQRLDQLQRFGRSVRERIVESPHALPPARALFVNLHPSELDDPRLFTDDEALHQLAPACVLEITERASLDLDDTAERLEQLRARGYRIALDDLGAGYAGLTALARIRPDIVKLDMSLVRGVERNASQRAVIRSVVGLGRELGYDVVAEGVETEAELDTVTGLGVRFVQGYLFAKPTPSLVEPSTDFLSRSVSP